MHPRKLLTITLMLFTKFVKHNCHSPKYVRVLVTYRGEDYEQEDIIALYTNTNNEQDPNDGKIMFYCNGIEELIPLIVSKKEDFEITRVIEFFDEF